MRSGTYDSHTLLEKSLHFSSLSNRESKKNLAGNVMATALSQRIDAAAVVFPSLAMPSLKAVLALTGASAAALYAAYRLLYKHTPAPTAAKDPKRYKLVACDMDGTLLNAEHKVSARNRAALQRLQAQGVHVVLCSGRMLRTLEPLESELGIDMNMVCYNGAMAVGEK
jgi:hypothetical protein